MMLNNMGSKFKFYFHRLSSLLSLPNSCAEMVSIFSLFPLVLFIIFLVKWSYTSSSTPKKKLPPSPLKLPIIGNLHQLGSHPYRSLQSLSKKYGPLMLLHFGSKPVLVASSADAAREIMKNHDLIFSSRPKLSIPDRLLFNSKDVVFSPYGEYWRTALGKKYSHGENGRKNMAMVREFAELLGVFCVGDYIPWLAWLSRLNGLDAKVERVAKQIDEFMEGIIEEHSQRYKSSEDEGLDFVDILLQIQRENKSTGFVVERDAVKALIMGMFADGTDTTHSIMEWAMTELLRHPKILEKLQNEVRQVAPGKPELNESDIEQMQYLNAVIKETLRLHCPVALLVPRESTQDIKVMGYDISAGTQVLVNAWAIGRNPELWKNPEEFQPERFLESDIDFRGFNFELIPFGAGRRGCPGISFGIAVNQLALAKLMHKFNFALPDGAEAKDLDVTEATGITIHRKFPLLVAVSPYPM